MNMGSPELKFDQSKVPVPLGRAVNEWLSLMTMVVREDLILPGVWSYDSVMESLTKQLKGMDNYAGVNEVIVDLEQIGVGVQRDKWRMGWRAGGGWGKAWVWVERGSGNDTVRERYEVFWEEKVMGGGYRNEPLELLVLTVNRGDGERSRTYRKITGRTDFSWVDVSFADVWEFGCKDEPEQIETIFTSVDANSRFRKIELDEDIKAQICRALGYRLNGKGRLVGEESEQEFYTPVIVINNLKILAEVLGITLSKTIKDEDIYWLLCSRENVEQTRWWVVGSGDETDPDKWFLLVEMGKGQFRLVRILDKVVSESRKKGKNR